MKPRKIYYRRKNKKIIIEGKKKNKVMYFLQLPSAEKLLEVLLISNSFPEKKREKIMTNLKLLDFKYKKQSKKQNNK